MSNKPSFKKGQDILAEGSKFQSFWEGEEYRKSQAMRSSGICIVCFIMMFSSRGSDKQFEGWETGILTPDMAQAMLSGCVVAMASPQVHHGELLIFISRSY